METLRLVAGWVVVLFMAGLGAIILLQIFWGRIDLKYLVSEENGHASLSRFQFLIFTFVIAMGLLVIILKTNSFPTIGSDVFGLLGISAGSYVASKITQRVAKPSSESRVCIVRLAGCRETKSPYRVSRRGFATDIFGLSQLVMRGGPHRLDHLASFLR